MYTRQESGARYPRVPRNYSGNAFRDPPPPPREDPSLPQAEEENLGVIEAVAEPPTDREESVAASARHEPFRLFRSGGGIGSEELLLLGLILLLSQNETKDDLLLLLVLLLFIQ